MSVVNLRSARKAKARADKAAKGAANAAKFGRTKAQRQREDDDSRKAAAHLDQHKRDPKT